MINNKAAKQYVSKLGKIGLIPVGSYGRSSHEESYKDLDFLSFKDLSEVYDYIFLNYKVKEVMKSGNKFIQVKLQNDNIIDVWKTSKDTFYEDYLSRILTKEKMIYIYKMINRNS